LNKSNPQSKEYILVNTDLNQEIVLQNQHFAIEAI